MLICSLLIALKVDLLQLNTLQSVLFVADHSKGGNLFVAELSPK